MNINRLVAISFLAVLGLVSNVAFSQTPFHYDTLKISFGYGMEDWDENSEESLSHEKSYIFCGARTIPNISFEGDESTKSLLDSFNFHEPFIDTLPRKLVNKYFEDKPCDTLQIIDSTGISYAVIKEIVFYGGGECGYLGCQLNRLDPKLKTSCTGNFVALRKASFYKGQVYSYHKLDTIPVAYQSIVALIKTRHLSKWLKNLPSDYFKRRESVTLEQAIDKNYCIVSVYKRIPLPIDDSLYIAINSDNNQSSCNCSLYLAYKLNGVWKYKMVINNNVYDEIENVTCAFDLNQDGQLEYMVVESDALGFHDSVIYTNLYNKWVRLTGGSAAFGN